MKQLLMTLLQKKQKSASVGGHGQEIGISAGPKDFSDESVCVSINMTFFVRKSLT